MGAFLSSSLHGFASAPRFHNRHDDDGGFCSGARHRTGAMADFSQNPLAWQLPFLRSANDWLVKRRDGSCPAEHANRHPQCAPVRVKDARANSVQGGEEAEDE
ncbi:hypothetical protein Taro_034905 [Colocasia esculenta]|uniref:Uncharacterized protein n=1 Tax=Colocasia esculenta TaxID=4460 RepID=A0A843VXM0_COLES|nr:hypothetical protein [Colocasia esculenta]